MKELEKIDITSCTVEDRRKVLRGYEAKLANDKKQRDVILIDMRKASAAADRGDQRARLEVNRLHKSDAAAGRMILSVEAQVFAARKRVEMAEVQAATVEAKRASADAGAVPHDRLFEVATPDGRAVRHRHASAAALQKELQPGYRVVAEVFGAGNDDKGGIIEPIGQSALGALLAAHGSDLLEWLAARGIKSTAA